MNFTNNHLNLVILGLIVEGVSLVNTRRLTTPQRL